MMGLWTAYKALSGVKSLAVNAGLVLALVGALWGAHKWQVRKAYQLGKADAIAAARVEAGKRIIEMEKNNASFRTLSARDRCLAFMRDSGLPGSHCGP